MSSKFFVQEDLSRAAKSRRRELEKLMRSIKAREPERRSTLFFCLFLSCCCCFNKVRKPERTSTMVLSRLLLAVCSNVVFDVVSIKVGKPEKRSTLAFFVFFWWSLGPERKSTLLLY